MSNNAVSSSRHQNNMNSSLFFCCFTTLVILCQGGQLTGLSTPRNLQFASPLHFPPPEAQAERKSGTHHHGGNLVSGISSSSSKDDVIAGKVLLADNRSHHHLHYPKATKRPQAAKAFPHRLLKFRDLPPWRSQKTFHHKGGVEALSRDPITLDLRQYNPLTAHLLTQSYVYPKSNGLTQTDRDYFAMIQSETGMSDVHFEKGGQEKKIKGDEASSKSRQLADCGRTKMGSSSCISDKDKKTTSTTTTTAATADTTHFTMKPVPRFAFHRVPGSFASFRVIRPLADFTLKPPKLTTTPSYDSYHDDEPPIAAVHQRAQRDVAAVHLVQ